MHVLFAAFMATTTASAATAECAWDTQAAPVITATPNTVTIDGQTWSVQGRYARQRFVRHLEDCGQAHGAAEFVEWRRAKRLTNTTLVAGIAFPLIWVASPVSAVLSGQQRDRMVVALGGDPGAGAVEDTLAMATRPVR
jgi:hypothetical protein